MHPSSKSRVVALIPARQGSKGVLNKNIRDVGGHPLIAYSVVAAKICRGIDRVIVTTDSPEIAEVAVAYGAEAPFLRPAEYADDASPDIDYISHAIRFLGQFEGNVPEYIVQLRPTTPLRDPALMAKAIEAIQEAGEVTSLRSVQELPEPPQKMMGIENGVLVGLFPDDPRPEYYNLPRQSFPPAYLPNGYIDIVRSAYVMEKGLLYGPKVQAFITPPSLEIDTVEELEQLQLIVDSKGHQLRDLCDAAKAKS